MREAKFSHDFLGDSEFQGYTRDEDYNGFACPYFSYDQAMLILQAWVEHGLAATYDENSDEFVFEVSGGEAGNEFQRFGAIYANGLKLYPIGASIGLGQRSRTRSLSRIPTFQGWHGCSKRRPRSLSSSNLRNGKRHSQRFTERI